MKLRFLRSVFALSILLLCSCVEQQNRGSLRETVYELQLPDPLQPASGLQSFPVTQVMTADGFILNYCARFCADMPDVKLDVTIHWDALGRFRKIEVPQKTPLLKSTGEKFTPDDYARLDAILHDAGSLLGDVPLSTFSGKKVKDVDGISGATAASIQNSVVKDAARISWILWTRVNGETASQLLALTRRTSTPQFIAHCLTGGDPAFVQYALELLSSGILPPQRMLTDAVFAALKTADRTASLTALEYLKKAVPDSAERHLMLAQLAGRASEAAGYQIIETLNAESDLNAGTLETLADQTGSMSYLEVHRVLSLLETRRFKSEAVVRSISALASGDNPFIARRAKEYLSRME